MILSPSFLFIVTLVTGFFFLLFCLVSVLIIYAKFHHDHSLEIQSDGETTFSDFSYKDSLTPLIWGQSIICVLISVNFVSLIKDVVLKGPFVWNRDNLGNAL